MVKKFKTKSLDEIKDKYIGKAGTPNRDQFEFDLKLDVIGEIIKATRLDMNLTQDQLGRLIGVQKAQISKIENSIKDVRLSTVIKTFQALKANVKLVVELDRGNELELV